MLDIRWIRENPDAFDAGLARRGLPPGSERLLALDQTRRDALSASQEMQARRNALSKEIGRRKGRGEDATDILAEVARCKDEQAALEMAAATADAELQAALATIPNLPAADVPDGRDETANQRDSPLGHTARLRFSAERAFRDRRALSG